MRRYILMALLVLLMAGMAQAQDQFDGIKCGTEIEKALIGKRVTNDAMAKVEARHKDLQLKSVGGDEWDDYYFLENWQVCGTEYDLIVKNSSHIVIDALKVPAHSRQNPMIVGECKRGAASVSVLIAIVANPGGVDPRKSKEAMLKATNAWTVDAKTHKFVTVPVENLSCAVGQAVTADGGN
jgi:hypothetical protein